MAGLLPFPLSKKTTLALNTQVDLGTGTVGLSYPGLKDYTSGGLGTVRGFEQGSLMTASQRAAFIAAGGVTSDAYLDNAQVTRTLADSSRVSLRFAPARALRGGPGLRRRRR